MHTVSTIDDYIASFPEEVREKLTAIRELVRKESPEAAEAIKYGMPTFVLGKNLIHFAAFKNHIGLFPTPGPIFYLAEELKEYETSKGGIRFPLSKPLPLALIRKIVRFRISEMKK